MAARLRNSDWREDENLRDDLVKYVWQNLRRKEILDLVQITYPMYAWSSRTLTLSWASCNFFLISKLKKKSSYFFFIFPFYFIFLFLFLFFFFLQDNYIKKIFQTE